MHQRSILVVDDDPAVRTLLRRCLESDGYRVTEAADSAGVRAALADSPPDLITLDLALGTESGLDLARDLRRDNAVPIIMVTGKDDVIERIVGLEVGADDYLTKPFHVREVLARVNAVLRRTQARPPAPPRPADGKHLVLDGLEIDLDRMTLTARDGSPCDLTTADFKLLSAFIENPRRPLSRDRLMDLVGGAAWTPLDRAIDNQVARLRKKVERNPAEARLIRTVRGIGYMLTEPAVAGGSDKSRSSA